MLVCAPRRLACRDRWDAVSFPVKPAVAWQVCFRSEKQFVKRNLAVLVLGLCALVSGCNLVLNATHNVAAEMHDHLDCYAGSVQHKRLARQVWQDVRAQNSGVWYSRDYANGFKEGFVDYLAGGGDGEPPAVPPSKYWKSTYETLEGHQAIEDWFAGFRHGVQAVVEGGYRRWVVMPSPAEGIVPASTTDLPPPRKLGDTPQGGRAPATQTGGDSGANPSVPDNDATPLRTELDPKRVKFKVVTVPDASPTPNSVKRSEGSDMPARVPIKLAPAPAAEPSPQTESPVRLESAEPERRVTVMQVKLSVSPPSR
jgi:hypothetical protein